VSTAQNVIDAVGERIALQGEKVRDEIRSGLAETRNGLRVKAARPWPIIANRPANSGPARVVGWSLRADTGAATVTVYDSRDNSGDVVATVQLGAGQSQTMWLGPGGVSCGEAVFCEVIGAGTVVGALYLGAVD
jgi:hypothetical protein